MKEICNISESTPRMLADVGSIPLAVETLTDAVEWAGPDVAVDYAGRGQRQKGETASAGL